MAWKEITKQRKVSHIALAKTLRMLLDGPVTAHEIAEETGIHLVTAQEWMRSLRKEQAVHISGWLPDGLGRDATAVYSAGKGKDKPRHKLTQAQRQARHRAKKKQLALTKLILGEPNEYSQS